MSTSLLMILERLATRTRCAVEDVLCPAGEGPPQPGVPIADGRLDPLAVGHLEQSSVWERLRVRMIFLRIPNARYESSWWTMRRITRSSGRSVHASHPHSMVFITCDSHRWIFREKELGFGPVIQSGANFRRRAHAAPTPRLIPMGIFQGQIE